MSEKQLEKTVKTKSSDGFLRKLFKDFFLGCVAFLPLVIVILVVYYLFSVAQHFGNLLFGITRSVWTACIVVILVISLLIYTGRKLRRKERWFLNFIEQLISKTPLLGGVYLAFKDMLLAFTSNQGDHSYLGTVKVSFGSGYIIGFVTKKEVDEGGVTTTTVFVPTSPNPTTGLVLFFSEDDVEYLDISPERAFKRIISLGMRS